MKSESRRNPDWTRDELILALDLYIQTRSRSLQKSDPLILELSTALNGLPAAGSARDASTYRNPNGVYMKLANLKSCDPEYHGKGLDRGNQLEQVVWDEFAGDPTQLRLVANAIKMGSQELAKTNSVDVADEGSEEGGVLWRVHKRRERDPRVTRKKKAAILAATGRLACEACGFDFRERYGPIGERFAECHHRVALAEVAHSTVTRLKDLAILCANCHRMVHRTRPLESISEFMNRIVGR